MELPVELPVEPLEKQAAAPGRWILSWARAFTGSTGDSRRTRSAVLDRPEGS